MRAQPLLLCRLPLSFLSAMLSCNPSLNRSSAPSKLSWSNACTPSTYYASYGACLCGSSKTVQQTMLEQTMERYSVEHAWDAFSMQSLGRLYMQGTACSSIRLTQQPPSTSIRLMHVYALTCNMFVHCDFKPRGRCHQVEAAYRKKLFGLASVRLIR